MTEAGSGLDLESIAGLERLLKAATHGPLDIERRDIDCGYMDYIVHSAKGDFAWCREELDPKAKANATAVVALWSAAPALIRAARDLLELRAKALRVTHRDVTDDELEHVTKLAIDARNALMTPGGSSAPIVRWLMWQNDRGLAVALELLTRRQELQELRSALLFLENGTSGSIVYGEDYNEIGLHPKDIIRHARELGWKADEHG